MECATLRLQDKLKACSQDAQGVSLIPSSLSSVRSCCMLPWIYPPPWIASTTSVVVCRRAMATRGCAHSCWSCCCNTRVAYQSLS